MRTKPLLHNLNKTQMIIVIFCGKKNDVTNDTFPALVIMIMPSDTISKILLFYFICLTQTIFIFNKGVRFSCIIYKHGVPPQWIHLDMEVMSLWNSRRLYNLKTMPFKSTRQEHQLWSQVFLCQKFMFPLLSSMWKIEWWHYLIWITPHMNQCITNATWAEIFFTLIIKVSNFDKYR